MPVQNAESNNMTKKKLIEIILRLLGTDEDIDFLNKLEETELKTLTACIRDRIDQIQR